MRQQHIVSCPHCGKRVIWEQSSRFRPFCSEQCKISDLSQWAQESYRIPGSTESIESDPDLKDK